MQHFFIPPDFFKGDKLEISDRELVHQLKNVLRMLRGDFFIALDGKGFEYECVFERFEGDAALSRILNKKKNTAEPEIHITVFQALPKKPETFEWVLQKGTELGVSAFVPVITQYCQRRELSKIERMEKILKEAAEQSERGIIPQLLGIQTFENAAKNCPGAKILLHGRGNFPLFNTELNSLKKEPKISIFIGPEGGFSPEEMKMAAFAGAKILSLGKRVLRTETAAGAACSAILYS